MMVQRDSQSAIAGGGDLESEEATGRLANRIFAKLQLVLPSFSSPKRTQTLPTPSTPGLSTNPEQKLKFIKVRIVTWNMHDSLPSGNLQDLLGPTPVFIERNFKNDDERFCLPNLSLGDGHPYHIVIVGGQECPTLSGIPMGLTANFKHKESGVHYNENTKAKNKWDRSDSERQRLGHTVAGGELSLFHPRNEHGQPLHHVDDTFMPPVTSGWTALLEDWLSNGVGTLNDVKLIFTTDPALEASETHRPPSTVSKNNDESNLITVNWKTANFQDNRPETNNSRTPPKGPYQLLVKDRLMGIYTAVFVHRDIYPLIKGVSTVPAGLIGGRLGNKGGVGISLNLAGTRLLLINAHLAAHDGNAALRVANLGKIKTELNVEPFLPPDDTRLLKEDTTEYFDYTWIFGDLNFRLDITRLHADWLISKKEYNKAFAFDELSELLKREDPVLKGFKEAIINFPPTFKYDIPHKKHGHYHKRASEVEKRDPEFPSDVAASPSSMPTEASFRIRGQFARRSVHTSLSHIALTGKHVTNNIWKRIRLNNPKTGKCNTGSEALTVLESKSCDPTPCKSNGYDSSSKQRVPGWCDRILWKTTVQPSDDTNTHNSNPKKIRVPSKMYTADSCTLEQTVMPKALTMVPGSQSWATSFDHSIKPLKEWNTSTEFESTRNPIPHCSMSTGEEYQKGLGRQLIGVSGSVSALSSGRMHKMPKTDLTLSKTSPKRWLPHFLTPREFGPTSRSTSIKLNHDGVRYRRGELVCLNYHTLDDEQMAKLEGNCSLAFLRLARQFLPIFIIPILAQVLLAQELFQDSPSKGLSSPKPHLSVNLNCYPLSYALEAQCSYVQEHCPESKTLLSLAHVQRYFCATNILRPFVLFGLLMWMSLLFSTLSICASDFLCPNLSTIAQTFRLDDSVAGVTLLAIGNGSPDLFATFSAMKANSGSLAIGELLGAASFIVSVVVGSMCIIKPFHVHPRTFLRDVGFFTLAAGVILWILHDGVLRQWEVNFLVGLYALYVCLVIIGSWWEKRRERRGLWETVAREEIIADNGTFLEPYRDEVPPINLNVRPPRTRAISEPNPAPNLYHNQRRSQSRSPTRLLSTSVASDPATTPSLPHFSLLTALEFRDIVSSLRDQANYSELSLIENSLGSLTYNHYYSGQTSFIKSHLSSSRTPLTPISENENNFSERMISLDQIGPEINSSLTTISYAEGFVLGVKQAIILFPHLRDLPKKSFLNLVVAMLATPGVVALTLTVPIVPTTSHDLLLGQDSDTLVENSSLRENQFNRWLTVFQCFLGPSFCAISLLGFTSHAIWYVLAIVVSGLTVGALLLIFPERRTSPKIGFMRCLMGFFIAVVWIIAIADEVVSTLKAIGLIFGLSDAIIGLTVFAIGNSLADLVANTSVAAFAPIMGFSACFGGPLLNILVGIGVSGSLIIGETGQNYDIHFSTTLLISVIGLLTILILTLIFVPWNGYFLTRSWGIFLIVSYVAIMTIDIFVEIKHSQNSSDLVSVGKFLRLRPRHLA